MPTSLTGLVLFVILLLPGFAYAVGRERAGVERKLPPLRETASIIAASVVSELLILLVFVVIRIAWPAGTPDVGMLIRRGDYLKEHYALVASWGVLLLGAASALAYAATRPSVRSRAKRLTGDYPHPSTASAWWVVFEKWKPRTQGAVVTVGCYLEDGSYIAGTIESFNNASEDTADRDLILVAPITYRETRSGPTLPLDAGTVVVSARRIMFMSAKHWMLPPPPASGEESEPQSSVSEPAPEESTTGGA